MAKQVKKKRKLLCKDCRRRQKQHPGLVGAALVTLCEECGRETSGEERVYCADCAEINGRCTWCGRERG